MVKTKAIIDESELEEELTMDELLMVLENPTRRKILEKLTKETHYPLQLSKELNVSQQAIMKHLKVLEIYGLVKSFEEKSTSGGPPRKSYVCTRNLSLRIDIGPNTFDAKMKSLDRDESPQLVSGDGEAKEIPSEFRAVLDGTSDPHERLSRLTKLIEELDIEIGDIENQRGYLARLRGTILKEVYRVIAELAPDYNERKVLYYVVRSPNPSIHQISEDLDIREKVLKDLFRHMRRHNLLYWLDEDDWF